jgi:hypothetical protein
MSHVDRLLRAANPVPEDRSTVLTARARAELDALVPGAAPAAPHRFRPRTLVLTGAAALVVGAVVVGALVVAPALTGGPPSSGEADEPFYGTTAELEGRADAIVVATVVSTADNQDNGYPETVATVDVSAVATGDVTAGTTMPVAYTTPGSGPEAPEGLAVGGEYVLLLETMPGSPSVLVNSTQGYYTVVDGHAVPTDANPVALDPATLAALGLS